MSLTQINKAGLDEIALDHVFTIGASGNSAYTFQGEGLNGTVNNPTLYLTRGKTYRFENGTGAHAIRIQSADNGVNGTLYNTGVTNNNTTGTVIVEVQHDAPDVLYYQCAVHASMKGTLYITGALADGGVTTAKLASGAVTTAKIAQDAVTSNSIANDAVAQEHIATNAIVTNNIVDDNITTAKIANNAVTDAKINGMSASKLTGALPAISGASLTDLPAGAVTNLIQNGNMAVHQRWGGSADSTNGWASADRFRLEYVNTVNGATQNIVRLTASSGNTDDPFDKGLRNIFQITNGNQSSTATNAMVQMAYGALARDLLHSGWDHTSSSSYLTLSYYVRSSVAGTFYGRVYTPLGGGSGKHFAWSTGALTANTWKRVTVQIPGDSAFAINTNSSADLTSFLFYFSCYAGTSTTDSSSPTSGWGAVSGSNQYPDYANANWYTTNGATMDFTGVQLEVGSTANPFVHEPYETTLRKCQQYYYVAASDNYENLGIGFQYYSGTIFTSVSFPVSMIAEPTLIAISGGSGAYVYEKLFGNSAQYHHEIALDAGKTGHSRAVVTMSGDNTRHGQAVRVSAHSTGSNAHRFVAFQAELS